MSNTIGRSTAGRATVSPRALGRATLHRQLLLHRTDLPVVAAVERLLGLNAQDPNPPYLALWSRLERFAIPELTTAIEDRSLVRSTLMRATQHLVSVPDSPSSARRSPRCCGGCSATRSAPAPPASTSTRCSRGHGNSSPATGC